MNFAIKETKDVRQEDIIELYKANHWSSAEKPEQLYKALLNSHSFVTAWYHEKLVGLGNALSDGHLVVYYPHLIVHPDFHGKGIGKLILKRFQEKYVDLNELEKQRQCGFIKEKIISKTQSKFIS